MQGCHLTNQFEVVGSGCWCCQGQGWLINPTQVWHLLRHYAGVPLLLPQVYQKLLDAGLQPISTTYTALISAFGKAGQLDKAMETFQTMIRQGCERSVITYSALISACEKAGRWELALELFDQMQHEGCTPNTVTYNSLITACQQGTGDTGRDDRAAEFLAVVLLLP